MQALKLGTAQYAYILNYTMDYTIKELKELGFRYIEIMTAPPHIWPPAFDQNQRKALRNQIENLGLELVAINPTYLDLNMADILYLESHDRFQPQPRHERGERPADHRPDYVGP